MILTQTIKVYVSVCSRLRMLGFTPENGTRGNLEYGESLMRESDHGSVKQMHAWWQDLMTYHAFKTKAGARWFGEHGGPKKFMRVVEEYLPSAERPHLPNPSKVEPKCFSCGESFGSLTKRGKYTVHRCTCGSKITHVGCFVSTVCPICCTKINALEYDTQLIKIMD